MVRSAGEHLGLAPSRDGLGSYGLVNGHPVQLSIVRDSQRGMKAARIRVDFDAIHAGEVKSALDSKPMTLEQAGVRGFTVHPGAVTLTRFKGWQKLGPEGLADQVQAIVDVVRSSAPAPSPVCQGVDCENESDFVSLLNGDLVRLCPSCLDELPRRAEEYSEMLKSVPSNLPLGTLMAALIGLLFAAISGVVGYYTGWIGVVSVFMAGPLLRATLWGAAAPSGPLKAIMMASAVFSSLLGMYMTYAALIVFKHGSPFNPLEPLQVMLIARGYTLFALACGAYAGYLACKGMPSTTVTLVIDRPDGQPTDVEVLG